MTGERIEFEIACEFNEYGDPYDWRVQAAKDCKDENEAVSLLSTLAAREAEVGELKGELAGAQRVLSVAADEVVRLSQERDALKGAIEEAVAHLESHRSGEGDDDSLDNGLSILWKLLKPAITGVGKERGKE
jgi:hypothetical protein